MPLICRIFSFTTNDIFRSSELLVINFHGSLKSYKVDRDKGCELQHTFLFNSCYPLGISSVVYHPGAGLLYVGGCGLEDEAGSEAMKEGLTPWRILSDYPHYKLVIDYSEDLKQVNIVNRVSLGWRLCKDRCLAPHTGAMDMVR